MTMPAQIGRYQVVRRLGGGGMGTVFLGRDPDLDRLVALKLLKDDLSDNPELRERFAREARSAARLRHPNIVTIFDIGEHEGRAFIAMEHVPGEALADTIRRGAPIPLVRKLALVEMLCAGLHHAHRAGIVHRDVKPANLMVDADGALKIVDFGIARLADSGLTRDGMLVGSVNYMSPEQIWGKPVDHRSDVFAVGAVFYELLSCQMAFPGGLSDGVFTRICQDAPVALTMVCPGLDEAIVAVVDRALQKEAANRYQDLGAMARDVSSIRERLGPDGPSDSSIAAMTSAATMPPGATPAPPFTPAFVGSRTPAPSGAPVGTPVSHGFSTDAQRLRNADVRADAAQMAFDRREYAKAQTLIDQAAAFDPSSTSIAALKQQIQAAADAAREAEQRRREVDEALAAARAPLERGDLAGARQHLERARALAPGDERVHALARRLQQAATDAERARASRVVEEATYSMAAARERSGLAVAIIAAIVLGAVVGIVFFLMR